MSNQVKHTELFEVAIQVRERFTDRFEARRDSGRQNPLAKRSRLRKRTMCAGFGLLASAGVLVALTPRAQPIGFTAGLLLFVAGIAGMVYQMPFVLSRNSMERLGRLVLPANGALRWLLIFGLISSVALQVVMVAQAPNEGYRPYLSAFVLLMQVGWH